MTSKREQVLSALHAALSAGVVLTGIDVRRGDPLPEQAPEDGLIILRDGDPGEPDVTLSPLIYHYQHAAEVELFVQAADGQRETVFDALARCVGTAVAADRTLGGLCDWVEAAAPEPADLPVNGAAPIKAAVITVTLHYSTPDPLI